MLKKPSPPAGSAGNNGKPQGKGSFLSGIFKRFTDPVIPEPVESSDIVPSHSQSAWKENRKYSRQVLDEFIDRIRRQSAKIDFLDRLLKSSSDAIIVAEPNGEVTMFNKGAETMFQIEEDIAKADTLFHLLSDASVDGALIIETLKVNQTISNMRVEIVGFSGKRTSALLTLDFVMGPPVPNSEMGEAIPEPLAIIAVIKDNSALEAVHAQLEKAHAELQAAYLRVEQLSLTDEKTGLSNRRHFDKEVGNEYERMTRGHMDAISLLFVDVDHFKKFNDTYGHQVGDQVLKLVADAIKAAVRQIDIPCRYGGEEMTVILPETDEIAARIVAERIRTRVAAIRFPVKDKETDKVTYATVTCSIGVSTHREEDHSNVEAFIKEADTAVYQAKQNGRNRTEEYQLTN